MANRKKRCKGIVIGTSRQCKLFSQQKSDFCYLHANQLRNTNSKDVTIKDVASATASAATTTFQQSNLDNKITNPKALLEDNKSWEKLTSYLSDSMKLPRRLLEVAVEKDLYITEIIRHGVQPSETYPNIHVVFKGGTALQKVYKIIHRFSEDVDINIVPPQDEEFGDSRKRNSAKEIHTRLEVVGLGESHHRRPNFSKSEYTYDSKFTRMPQTVGLSQNINQGKILLEIMVRRQIPDTQRVMPVCSFAGEAASRIDSSLLEEYPFLNSFDVLVGVPQLSLVDKLDAMNWRSLSDNPEQVGGRSRDIYDIACILLDAEVQEWLRLGLIDEWHQSVLAELPASLQHRYMSRPEGGFAASPAFQPGHPACEALRETYPKLRQIVFHDDHWIGFDDALEIIAKNAEWL